METKPRIVVAHPSKSSIDPLVGSLADMGLLKLRLTGRKTIISDCDPSLQRRFPAYGLCEYLAGKTLNTRNQEMIRFSLVPVFDRWVTKHLVEGDTLLTGIGYLVGSLNKNRSRGGINILRAGNSHPSDFWSIVAEEHAHWSIRHTPILPLHHMRQQFTVELADWLISPSDYVTNSFVNRGFDRSRIISLPTVVDTTVFKPNPTLAPSRNELVLCCSARLSFRKGAPYLFEAFEIIRKEIPHARLKLMKSVESQLLPVLDKLSGSQKNIDWCDSMRHPQLADWLSRSDIFVLPTLEEGMVRSAAEAMSVGLPVITTLNSGIDALQHHVNGSIVPIRDPEAIAREVIHWWDIKRKHGNIRLEPNFDELIYRNSSYLTNIKKGLNQIWQCQSY